MADPADAEAGRLLYLDQTDGLSGEGVNTGSYFADSDGSIWLGIDLSIFHYLPPADLLTPRFAPQVFLSSFSWGGAGQYAVQGVLNADVNPVLGFVVFSAILSLIIYLVVDLIYFALDLLLCVVLIPRIGLAGAAIASSVALVFESASLFVVAKYRLGFHCFVFGGPRDT